jgi:tRNA threonylcarbamoyladenosine biosynthesis protein TsaE
LKSSTERLKDRQAARAWVKKIAVRLHRPCVVLLSGELGAGKTQFVRWFLQEWGAKDVASPTFAIHHEYETERGRVDHIDLYRVESDADLESSGFWDLLQQDDALMFVEWAERLPEDVWPESWNRFRLRLLKGEGDERFVEMQILSDLPG